MITASLHSDVKQGFFPQIMADRVGSAKSMDFPHVGQDIRRSHIQIIYLFLGFISYEWRKKTPGNPAGVKPVIPRFFSGRRNDVNMMNMMNMLQLVGTISGWWYTYPSEKYERQLG